MATHGTSVVPPSDEVRGEAATRARRIAEGLFPHQVEGLAFLLGRRRSILADDMGLGKTRQSILALTEAEPTGPYLVICPASVKRNWAREIAMVRPGLAAHVVGPLDPPAAGFSGFVIVNYDLLQRHLAALQAHAWKGLVFDEAHFIKNHTSQRSKYSRQLVEKAGSDPVVHALTGTPLTNRPRDLFPLLQLVRHPLGKSFFSFAKRYCAAYDNGYGLVSDGASNLEELTLQLHGILLRRRKDDVLSLPPKIRTYLDVDVPEATAMAETRQVFELLLESQALQASGREGTRANPRVQLIALLTKARRKLAVAKTKACIEFIQGAIDQGEKVLVFSCFDEPVQQIAKAFEGQSVTLTGSTPTAKRQELVDRFQNDPGVRVFVANLIAGGIGLNLTAATQVVFNDLDWVPANHYQGEDRAYRIGQTRCVTVTYLIGTETVDQFVKTVLETKAALVDAVVEGRAVEIGGDALQELQELVGRLSPRLADAQRPTNDPGWIRAVIAEAVEAYRRERSVPAAETAGDRPKPVLSDELIALLAKVLGGPGGKRFRVASSSKPGQFYELDANGADVTCTCRGFEFRGMCQHARTLKAALVAKGPLPEGFSAVEGG